VSVVIEVTGLPLLRSARRTIAEDPDLLPRPACDDHELVFASSPDASPATLRLSDAARQQAPITAAGHHFRC
jgi:hypothetical protein